MLRLIIDVLVTSRQMPTSSKVALRPTTMPVTHSR